MAQVLIVIEGEGAIASSAAVSSAISALTTAIQTYPSDTGPDRVWVVTVEELLQQPGVQRGRAGTSEGLQEKTQASHDILIPLTLQLPTSLTFPGSNLYATCADITQLRQRVAQQFHQPTGTGTLWLPIVLTARGPLYAEAIAQAGGSYQQPLHLSDRHRQPLYHFARQLLHYLSASPATYLLQCNLQADRVIFDRLFPFPAEPAIASLPHQSPDLYDCHWRCLTHQPILDVRIDGSVAYRAYGKDEG